MLITEDPDDIGTGKMVHAIGRKSGCKRIAESRGHRWSVARRDKTCNQPQAERRSGTIGAIVPDTFPSTIHQPVEDFADQSWSMLMARLNNDR